MDKRILICIFVLIKLCKMKKVLAFGASSSKKSINKILASFAANQIENSNINLLDLNDFEMPIYSEDYENENGIPKAAFQFKKELNSSDGIIISFAEHNGSYTAAFKNIYDWISVIETDVWCSKPIFLLSTSTGPRGGKTILKSAHKRFSANYKYKIPYFSLPSFNENFNSNEGITNVRLNQDFQEIVIDFEKILNQI